ncbi:MAG: tetratricopeptide repeat protein [Woeseiaceae bacterium]|nr:tetratricopeptide repeat protein [Woeseiaceae bacterium]
MRQNNADAASAILQPLLAGEAVDSQSLAMAARANMAAGDYDAATELLKRRVDQEPTNSALQLDLAAAYLAAGDVAAAEAILAAGTDTTEADAYRRDMLGVMSRVRADDFEAAIAAARAMIADHPDDARLRNMLGGIYLAMDNDDAARAEFDAALAIEAGNRTALLNLGRMAASQGDYDAARGRFSTVLDAAPDDAGAMIALGMVEAADGNRERSIEWLEKARAAAADNAMARTMLARQYLATEDFENAEAVATEAVTIAPQSAQAHAVLGAALEGQGDERGALESYRRATELDPDNTAYSLSYARAQLRAGQQSEAASTLERVESRGEPDLRASLQIAAMTASAGDVDRAIRMGEELMQQFPDSEMPHVLLGEIHFRNGNATEGAAQFERALDKRMSARIAGRAFTLRRANNVDPAERPLERFLEQNPDNETARLALAQHYQTSGNDEGRPRNTRRCCAKTPTTSRH